MMEEFLKKIDKSQYPKTARKWAWSVVFVFPIFPEEQCACHPGSGNDSKEDFARSGYLRRPLCHHYRRYRSEIDGPHQRIFICFFIDIDDRERQ